jgi:hypothetical protein
MFSRTFASQFSALNFSSGAQRLLGPNDTEPTNTDVIVYSGVSAPTRPQPTRDTNLDNFQF